MQVSEEDDNVEQDQVEEEVDEASVSEEHCYDEDDEEPGVERVAGPFAVLIKTLDLLDTAWDHAVGKDDFEKMIAVVNKTLEVNDRYMAIQITQEDSNERVETGHPEQFGFQAEIADRPRPPDVKSR